MIATEAERHLLALVLPRVEALLLLMRSEGIAEPVESFKLLLGLDPDNPPAIEVARYLPLVVALRSIFLFGGNETALEVAMARAADLVAALQ